MTIPRCWHQYEVLLLSIPMLQFIIAIFPMPNNPKNIDTIVP